jgi:ABC-type multidrug transport system ATPase subunit
LISAFSSNAELLLLDEPTSGLDPLMEQLFAECVTDAAARGTTVLLSSHILSEVEKLCERVTIIRDGRTVDSGPQPTEVIRLRELLRAVRESQELVPSLLPVGDGLLCAVKR